ncbi:GNAT family N-acetyltransferase [Clostridia bacterium OttesenSCG-928-F22]|nr:GNAT family N-acetyltransferase [Clostridia bacterium OttesenSCG-928-F22]
MIKNQLAYAEETNAVKQIWHMCFDDPSEFTAWYFENKYEPENTLVVRGDGPPFAALQMLPMEILLRDTACKTGFIVGVSTLPEHRGKGYATSLMKDAFGLMRERGMAFSSLYPVRYDFYRRLGYEVNSGIQRYQMFIKDIDSVHIPEGYSYELSVKDANGIGRLYREFIGRYSGGILRGDEQWDLKLSELALDGKIVVAKQGLIVHGYAMCAVEKGVLTAFEVVYRDQGALHALIKGMQQIHGGKAVLYLPSDSMLYGLLDNGRDTAYVEPFGMLRVLDVSLALNGMQAGVTQNMDIQIRLHDELAPWNEGTFALCASNGKFQVEKGSTAELEVDIGGFTQLVCGFLTAEQLVATGRMACSSADALRRAGALFPRKETLMFDKW